MADLKISALTASTTPLAGTEVLPIVQSSTTKQVSVANLTAGRAVSALSYASTTGATFATTSGNVGIGASAPAAALAFSKGDGETNGMVIGHPNWANTYYAGIYGTVTNGGSNTQGILRVGTRVNATDATLTNIVAFRESGNVDLNIGNLVISTSGKGIDFSATAGTGTSELLADYEEGTWTPVVTPVSGSITTQTCTGSYVKVGNQVTVTFDITINNVGTGTTLNYIAGLPFTSANTAQQGSSAARERSATGLPWVFQTGQNQTRINGWSAANSQTIANYAWQGSVTYLTA
jgi:hypothetical protein